MKTPIQLKSEIKYTKIEWVAGRATLEDVYAAADRYIAAVKANCKNRGVKAPRMSRAGLLR